MFVKRKPGKLPAVMWLYLLHLVLAGSAESSEGTFSHKLQSCTQGLGQGGSTRLPAVCGIVCPESKEHALGALCQCQEQP